MLHHGKRKEEILTKLIQEAYSIRQRQHLGKKVTVSESFDDCKGEYERISGLTDKIKASSGVALRYSSLNDFESSSQE